MSKLMNLVFGLFFFVCFSCSVALADESFMLSPGQTFETKEVIPVFGPNWDDVSIQVYDLEQLTEKALSAPIRKRNLDVARETFKIAVDTPLILLTSNVLPVGNSGTLDLFERADIALIFERMGVIKYGVNFPSAKYGDYFVGTAEQNIALYKLMNCPELMQAMNKFLQDEMERSHSYRKARYKVDFMVYNLLDDTALVGLRFNNYYINYNTFFWFDESSWWRFGIPNSEEVVLSLLEKGQYITYGVDAPFYMKHKFLTERQKNLQILLAAYQFRQEEKFNYLQGISPCEAYTHWADNMLKSVALGTGPVNSEQIEEWRQIVCSPSDEEE